MSASGWQQQHDAPSHLPPLLCQSLKSAAPSSSRIRRPRKGAATVCRGILGLLLAKADAAVAVCCTAERNTCGILAHRCRAARPGSPHAALALVADSTALVRPRARCSRSVQPAPLLAARPMLANYGLLSLGAVAAGGSALYQQKLRAAPVLAGRFQGEHRALRHLGRS